MLVVCSKLVEEVLASFNAEGVGVIREVTVLEHVVDVIPDYFQRDAKLAVVVYHLFGLTPVLVALYPKSAHNSETIRGALISDRDLYGHWPGEIHTQRHWWKPKPQ